MVTTPLEVATASRPSLGRKGCCGCTVVLISDCCHKVLAIRNSKPNMLVLDLTTPYRSATAGRLPASCRTPLQMPDETFVLGQAIGQGWLGVRSAETRKRQHEAAIFVFQDTYYAVSATLFFFKGHTCSDVINQHKCMSRPCSKIAKAY